MGQVYCDFDVRNEPDSWAGQRAGSAPSPREVHLQHIIMDTGASHLCLPADVIRRLGLPFGRDVHVQIPTGVVIRRIFRGALVVYEDREALVEVIELPEGSPGLLGAIPMEGLGIEPDLQNRRVRKLPFGPNGSYVTA